MAETSRSVFYVDMTMYHIYTVCMHECIPMTSQLCNSLPSYHGSGLPGKWALLGPMSEVGKNGYGPWAGVKMIHPSKSFNIIQ